ncbi:MAG: endonuclease G [Saprospiraceae bacterium]|jgi:endonuclease G
MAKLRKNHNKTSGVQSSGMISKVGIFSLILGALYFAFQKFSGGGNEPADVVIEDTSDIEYTDENEIFYLPTSTTGQIVKHQYYAISYNEEYEQPEWVAYELTKDRLYTKGVGRTNDFRPDIAVKTGSASLSDYRGSGYDRGHLVPAGDMGFDYDAMSETFFMSNMSPQKRNFNGGIWRELEELTRSWAKKFRHLYVVTGPILTEKMIGYIGENEVGVPSYYYKVVLDLSEPEMKGIAYIMPNEVSDRPIHEYATSIDKVEEITGINFFSNLMEARLEEEIEKEYNTDLWFTDKKKYDKRVNSWNRR